MMEKYIFFLLFAIIFKLVVAVHHPEIPASTFCYDDPSCDSSTWGGMCKTGRSQSPIDINVNDENEFLTTKFWMNDHYLLEKVHRFYAQNNGHTAQFELNPNTSALTSDLFIYGGELKGMYRFAQFHFHWAEVDGKGSEHTLNGQRYPMEAHLVHYKSDYSSLADALKSTDDPEAVAVFAVLFDIGANNPHLQAFIRPLQALRQPGEVKEFDFSLRILDLYPENLEFIRYRGSLTTPTCDEKVVWTVFLTPLEISEGQIKQFRLLSNAEGNSDFNFRPTQPLNGRKLEYYVAKG